MDFRFSDEEHISPNKSKAGRSIRNVPLSIQVVCV